MAERWQLRPMQGQDLTQVVAIEQAVQLLPWTESMFGNCLAANNYQCWVAVQSGRVVGFAVAVIQLDECHILNIAVLPALQRQGMGRALLQQILQIARDIHVKLAFLEVRLFNQPAIELYREFGFTQAGLRKNYYYNSNGQYEDALFFTKMLSDKEI
ncbi:MAG: ribosomal protein S18-alanine N-acetyltransferase [Gammaproteobacteria bacterium]